jgi:hypothetical protein
VQCERHCKLYGTGSKLDPLKKSGDGVLRMPVIKSGTLIFGNTSKKQGRSWVMQLEHLNHLADKLDEAEFDRLRLQYLGDQIRIHRRQHPENLHKIPQPDSGPGISIAHTRKSIWILSIGGLLSMLVSIWLWPQTIAEGLAILVWFLPILVAVVLPVLLIGSRKRN